MGEIAFNVSVGILSIFMFSGVRCWSLWDTSSLYSYRTLLSSLSDNKDSDFLLEGILFGSYPFIFKFDFFVLENFWISWKISLFFSTLDLLRDLESLLLVFFYVVMNSISGTLGFGD